MCWCWEVLLAFVQDHIRFEVACALSLAILLNFLREDMLQVCFCCIELVQGPLIFQCVISGCHEEQMFYGEVQEPSRGRCGTICCSCSQLGIGINVEP